MLDTIIKRGPKAFAALLRAFVETHQEQYARLLDPGLTERLVRERDCANPQPIAQPTADPSPARPIIVPSSTVTPVQPSDPRNSSESWKATGGKETIPARAIHPSDEPSLKPEGCQAVLVNEELSPEIQKEMQNYLDGLSMMNPLYYLLHLVYYLFIFKNDYIKCFTLSLTMVERPAPHLI